MLTKTLRKIILIVVLLTFLLGISGCQGVKGIENTAHAFSNLPDRLVLALTNLLGGMKDVGIALTDQIGNIVHNMTGK